MEIQKEEKIIYIIFCLYLLYCIDTFFSYIYIHYNVVIIQMSKYILKQFLWYYNNIYIITILQKK